MAHARKEAKRFRQLARREPNGRPQRPTTRAARRHETERQIMAVALAQPHRQGDRDQKRGSVLGRLRLCGAIDEPMMKAGDAFQTLASRHMRYVETTKFYPAQMYERVSAGLSGFEPTPEAIERIRGDYRLAARILGRDLESLLVRVCVLDIMPTFGDEIDGTRKGLRALAELWG